jgi:RNA-directed DNA polymerase
MNTAKRPMYEWQDLPWKKIERVVFKLQKRIYRASQGGDTKAVHNLQRLLVNSWSARCLAVRRVTQDNRGKNTAGVDGVKWMRRAVRIPVKTITSSGDGDHPDRSMAIAWSGPPGGDQAAGRRWR